jgi:hypothetical protein
MANGKCSTCLVVLTIENSTPSTLRAGYGYCNACSRNRNICNGVYDRSKERTAVLRERVFNKLGARCSHCGFGDRRALQIDHINGGGSKNRKNFSQTTFLKYVLDNLGLFQILCANCNWIKRRENKEDLIVRKRFPLLRKHTNEN